METLETTYAPTGSDGGADDAAAGGSTSLPGLPADDAALIDRCAELGMWKVDGELCFGKTRAWALERASDLLIRDELVRSAGVSDPHTMALAYAWITYAEACRETVGVGA